jgi:hypothetical protein
MIESNIPPTEVEARTVLEGLGTKARVMAIEERRMVEIRIKIMSATRSKSYERRKKRKKVRVTEMTRQGNMSFSLFNYGRVFIHVFCLITAS